MLSQADLTNMFITITKKNKKNALNPTHKGNDLSQIDIDAR